MPPDLVTVEDVRDRLHRPLSGDEERVLPSWIVDAWDALMDMRRLRLEDRLSTVPPEDGLLGRVRRVILRAVLRRLTNPDRVRQYSYTVDDATVSETRGTETLGDSWFTDDDLSGLEPDGLYSDAFTIRTDAGRPGPCGPLTPPIDEWYPWTFR